jgi:hypothetical protein
VIDVDGNSTSNSTNNGNQGSTSTSDSGPPDTGITRNMMIVIIVCSVLVACLFTIMLTYCLIRSRRIESAKIFDANRIPKGMSKIKKSHFIAGQKKEGGGATQAEVDLDTVQNLNEKGVAKLGLKKLKTEPSEPTPLKDSD